MSELLRTNGVSKRFRVGGGLLRRAEEVHAVDGIDLVLGAASRRSGGW